MNKLHITLIERDSGHTTAVITTKKGFCYAVTYAPDTEISREKIESDWKNDRQDFLPFNTASLSYCENDGNKSYNDIF